MDLKDFYLKYPTQGDCIELLELTIWNGIPSCPYCKSNAYTPVLKEFRYHCNDCNTSYSVTVNTLFHKTKVDLQKWFYVMCLEFNIGQQMSVRMLASAIDVTKDTASFIKKRIREDLIENGDVVRKILNEFSKQL